jgi:hypothetical protein
MPRPPQKLARLNAASMLAFVSGHAQQIFFFLGFSGSGAGLLENQDQMPMFLQSVRLRTE